MAPADLIGRLQLVFEPLPQVVVAYLFGSYARGQAGLLSDVDVAVLLSGQPTESECFDVRLDILERAITGLGRNEVDVAVLNQTPLALRYRVVRDGQIIVCRDEAARLAFTARTVSMYLDFKPALEVFERATLQRARKGELTHGYNPHRGAVERYRRFRQSLTGTPTPDVH